MGSGSARAPAFGRLKTGARAFVVAVGFASAASPVFAQHCEPPAAPDASLGRATVRAEAAHYESGGESGFYEGLGLGASLRYAMLRARASLPYYRLLAPGEATSGFGDLEGKLEVAVRSGETWSFGGAFAASFPTGSAEKRLGMGHVMLGPSAWLSRRSDRVFVSAELGFMGALDAESEAAEPMPAHHHQGAAPANAHHGGGGPIPNPMNPDELWAGLSASYEPARILRLSAGGTVAYPTSDEGETRATLRASIELPVGEFETGLGFELDLAGVTRREVGVANVGWLF